MVPACCVCNHGGAKWTCSFSCTCRRRVMVRALASAPRQREENECFESSPRFPYSVFPNPQFWSFSFRESQPFTPSNQQPNSLQRSPKPNRSPRRNSSLLIKAAARKPPKKRRLRGGRNHPTTRNGVLTQAAGRAFRPVQRTRTFAAEAALLGLASLATTVSTSAFASTSSSITFL